MNDCNNTGYVLLVSREKVKKYFRCPKRFYIRPVHVSSQLALTLSYHARDVYYENLVLIFV